MLGVAEISNDVKAMADRARKGRVKLSDIEGSTFSISNLGMYGITRFSAIINPPDNAILVVGEVNQFTVVEEEEISISNRMELTIFGGHRVSDGAEARSFLNAIKRFLENPISLLI